MKKNVAQVWFASVKAKVKALYTCHSFNLKISQLWGFLKELANKVELIRITASSSSMTCWFLDFPSLFVNSLSGSRRNIWEGNWINRFNTTPWIFWKGLENKPRVLSLDSRIGSVHCTVYSQTPGYFVGHQDYYPIQERRRAMKDAAPRGCQRTFICHKESPQTPSWQTESLLKCSFSPFSKHRPCFL